MVVQRRVGPLLVVLGAALGVVLARAFQVQVLQHGIWKSEASSMQQSAEVLPYHRGRILDANKVVLAHDEDQFEIRLCYRDFRRGSPIAQLAHARSSLEMRAVPLSEAEQHLEPWAKELVQLRPIDLAGFAQGKSLPIAGVPELAPEEAKLALRERRAADLRYYAAELLELPVLKRKALAPAQKHPDSGLALIEIAAHERGMSAKALGEDLERRLVEARAHLAHLAELVELGGKPLAQSGSTPFERLLAVLEAERRDIENDTADALFHEAAGFDPGRVRTRVLEQRLDTSWVARALRWDDARCHEWVTTRRARWETIAAEVLVPRALLRAQHEPITTRRADRLLSELAVLFRPEEEAQRAPDGEPRSWREFDEPCVFSELDNLFEHSAGLRMPEEDRSVLPFSSGGLEELAREDQDHWRVVGALADLSRGAAVLPPKHAQLAGWRAPVGPLEAAQRWQRIELDNKRLDGDAGLAEGSWLFFALEERFQDELERRLDLAYERCGASAPIPFEANRRSRAAETERYVLLDRSTRPGVICRAPSWDLVELVTRGVGSYAGFSASPTSKRLHPERDSQGVELAAGLVGSVRRPTLGDLITQGRERTRLAELRDKLVRTSEEAAEVRELAARLYRNDEWAGATGVEAWLDDELRGENGVQQTFSMAEEVQAAETTLEHAPIDGRDVQLTLVADLQRAAQEVLAHPEMPGGDENDQLWCKYPVGAIVLLTPEGDVLADASAPSQDRLAPTPGRDDEHSHLRERSLQRPTVTPPGSSFKPFVAAYALDKRGLDPLVCFSCEKLAGGGFGYKTIHCHGHHEIALHDALADSCNAYFGQLGEKFYTPQSFLEMAHIFGFGEATGISDPRAGRGRLHEDSSFGSDDALSEELSDHGTSMRFACGLFPMEATPMQVARATAGLVKGTLPEVRLVSKVGDEELAPRSRPLGISEASLDIVRTALLDTVKYGTADIAGLKAKSLGFAFACKTGSADVKKFVDSPLLTEADKADMNAGKWRKHTWVAGWFPAEKPVGILVVYLHDVSETATHSSVFIAAQFLHMPAVQRFAREGK